jgi:hypothetical protein
MTDTILETANDRLIIEERLLGSYRLTPESATPRGVPSG